MEYIDVHHDSGRQQAKTKAFRQGDCQAVRIPAELAYERADMELEIGRVGDELRIRPVRCRICASDEWKVNTVKCLASHEC